MKHKIELFYGCERGEEGVYHSFLTGDPDDHSDLETVEKALADMLSLDPDDQSFNWDSMYIDLPDSVVEKIKAEGVKEYLENKKGEAE